MAEDPDHSASHWLQRLPEEQPEAFKVPVTHVQSSQLVQLVLDPEVAKTITSDCSRHGLVEVSYFETSSAEALVADAGKGLAAEAESQDESLTGATQAISSGYSVSQTGVPTLYPEDASGLSGPTDIIHLLKGKANDPIRRYSGSAGAANSLTQKVEGSFINEKGAGVLIMVHSSLCNCKDVALDAFSYCQHLWRPKGTIASNKDRAAQERSSTVIHGREYSAKAQLPCDAGDMEAVVDEQLRAAEDKAPKDATHSLYKALETYPTYSLDLFGSGTDFPMTLRAGHASMVPEKAVMRLEEILPRNGSVVEERVINAKSSSRQGGGTDALVSAMARLVFTHDEQIHAIAFDLSFVSYGKTDEARGTNPLWPDVLRDGVNAGAGLRHGLQRELSGRVTLQTKRDQNEGNGVTPQKELPTLQKKEESSSSDTGRSQVQAYGASFTELQVAALVDKLTESQNRQVQGVDIPAAHAVPLPFPESKDTSALLSINVEKLESGEDTRTTVMVARIPKTCTSERFLTRLRDLDLLNKLRFFYMPIDVSRNRPCGYVFMDFQEPADVVRLCRNLLQLGNFIGARIDRKMQVNFARIQGWEGLLQHFSGSEITFEPDANRRPQFFFPPQSVNVATFKATGDIAALQQLQ
ncbi:Protein MEI2-like 5 [Symbiodinium microadriaticum]|uniref:Protein MEI2-like 5 n=1 Tax=Symbiodinium microadriaticum TaxID=2951 RepID=A0A1Q9EBL5_SYMMI|nr:Protein MEI2-like 5 [Symbiodinium microadriaticum]